jgi:2-polyprenyl-3-methyl-5-hydroxy-6-metoxy-1,4-benzoquinol methylase
MSKLDDVKHRFEWDAENFAAIYDGSSRAGRWFQRLFRKAVFVRYQVAMAESGDIAGKSVLDIGCGSGVYCIELAKRGATRVLGIDFSESMLSIARDAARSHGVADRIEFISGEFMKHDFGEERFDLSIAMGVFDYLEQPAPFLAKMSALTRAKLVASFPRFSLVRGTARRLRYRLSGRGDVFYYSPREVERLARDARVAAHRLVRVDSSGGGVILVGDNRR